MKPLTGSIEPTKSIATAYHFRIDPIGWAIFTVNDHTGELSIQSDYGDATNRWNVDHLGSPSLTDFIRTTDVHYLAGKLFNDRARSDREELNRDTTLSSLREDILQRRRRGDLSRDDARELWRDAKRWLDSSDDISGLWYTQPDSFARFFESPGDHLCMADTGRVVRMREMLSIFKAYLQAEHMAPDASKGSDRL